MKKHFRIIGDVHGHSDRYLRLLRKAEYSLQVGDVGFDYSFLNGVDPERHKFVGGNHDNYDRTTSCHHYLGDYGTNCVPGIGDIFFVRGAASIDMCLRTEGVNWWRGEEISTNQGNNALEIYEKERPDFVVTHDCPVSVVCEVTNSSWIKMSYTQMLLQAMLDIHRPKTWVFGHFHKSWRKLIDGTEFVCLDELECLDFPKNKG